MDAPFQKEDIVRAQSMIAGMLIASLVLAPGCAHKYVAKVAVCDPRDEQRHVEPAPRTGMYKVQLIDEHGHYLVAPLYAADRWVRKGDPLGFEQTEDGKLLAVAGPQQVELAALPPSAAHVMWYHKSKQPTQFAKSASKVGNATAQAVLYTAAGIGLAAGTAALVWFALQPDPCDDPPSKEHRHRH